MLIVCFSLVNFIVNIVMINGTDKQGFRAYDTTKNEITYKHTLGKDTKIIFGDESVKIVDSHELNRKERLEILCFIVYCFKEKEIPCSRTIQNLEGELITHNLLYKVHYKRDNTQDADLDYTKDKRWYVNTTTIIMQILGL